VFIVIVCLENEGGKMLLEKKEDLSLLMKGILPGAITIGKYPMVTYNTGLESLAV
jgi:hypothetical protein